MMIPALILLSAFLLNIPFGYLRVREQKYTWKWFLWIHMPVPIIVAERILSNTDISFVPFIIAAAFVGQYLGGRIGKR
jgi:hypothetical protein